MANEWDFNRIQRTIAVYVDRNDVAHSHIGELASQGDYLKLLSRISEDLKALADIPASCRSEMDTAKQAILTTAHKYFEKFEWDDESSRVTQVAWNDRPQKQAPTPDAPKPSRKQRRRR